MPWATGSDGGECCCWASSLTTLGSVVCALADSYPLLVVGRSLQGVSTAMIPTAISLLYQSMSGASLQRGVRC